VSYWRAIAKPIIARVIREVGTDDRAALKAALLEAYPFGPMEHHPYKIWRDEIKRQLGEKSPLHSAPRHKPAANQISLF